MKFFCYKNQDNTIDDSIKFFKGYLDAYNYVKIIKLVLIDNEKDDIEFLL